MLDKPSAAPVGQSASNLWAWLQTWQDGQGGIHGPVVYHHRDNLKVLRPDTWTQGAALIGVLNLYRASGDSKYISAGQKLGKFLADNYIEDLHFFRDSNFDQKPLGQPALEGNSIASLSLLELAKVLGSEGRFLVEAARDNLTEFVTKQWDRQTKSFSVEYHGRRASIHNKSSMAIMAIMSLAETEGNSELVDSYARPAAEHIVSTQVKAGPFAGAFPYSDRDASYRTMYSLLTALGLLRFGEATGETKYADRSQMLVRHLTKFVDPKTGLISHYHNVGYPQWINDTLLYHVVSRKVARLKGEEIDLSLDEGLAKVLSYQYPSGAFLLSLGFDDLYYKDYFRSTPGLRRWRDILPTTGMNAWNLWFLSELLKPDQGVPPPSITLPFSVISDKEEVEGPYEIVEGTDELRMLKLPDKTPSLIIRKTDDVPVFCGITERANYWKTIDALMRYPFLLRRVILFIPRIWLKIRR